MYQLWSSAARLRVCTSATLKTIQQPQTQQWSRKNRKHSALLMCFYSSLCLLCLLPNRQSSIKAVGVTLRPCRRCLVGVVLRTSPHVTLLSLFLCPLMPRQCSWGLTNCSCVDKRVTSVKCQVPWKDQRRGQESKNYESSSSCFNQSPFRSLCSQSSVSFGHCPACVASIFKTSTPYLIIYTLEANWRCCFLWRKRKGVCGGIKGMHGLVSLL